MPLSPGTRLGPYEVLAFIGAGGMGEVYKARDARLDRPVALKLLSSRPDGDLDLKHRFRREARAIAALTHPHICVLHDISEQDGTEFLVMEYLEGETLAQRLALGPLAVDQALRHAIEIASALDKAHGRGVVHRDLKPGNVMLTSGGAKLLDFGLAKLRPPAESGTGASPSVTGALSGEGKIVGTLNYMAPEQLQGRAVDARADIFAFGAVVYEMVTAQRAFDGSSHVSVIAEILERDPLPMTACQPLTPPMLDHVVRRCLAKDPEERWQSAHDVLVDLQWIAEGRSQMVGAGGRTTRGRPARRWVVLAGCALAAAAAGTLYARRARPSPAQSMQFSLIPPEGVTLTPGVPGLSVSPDGKWLAFAASDPSTPWPRWRLWLRRVDSLAAEPLPGTENATSPFWSPDSASIGFIAGDKLERLDLGGSPPRMLCGGAALRGRWTRDGGGTWNRDGLILFASNDGLALVTSAGGEPKLLTKVDPSRQEWSHSWPEFLPDGRRFLYLRRAASSHSGLYLGSLDAPEGRRVGPATSNVAYSAGQVLFVRDGVLYRQPFEIESARFTGDGVRLAERVVVNPQVGRAAFGLSQAGLLAYRSGGAANMSRLAWFDRQGKELGSVGLPRPGYSSVELSPDDRYASATDNVGIPYQPGDIWLVDLARGSTSRLTTNPRDEGCASFSPDGRRTVFGSNRRGHYDLYLKSAGGASEEQLLYESSEDKCPTGWSPDGRFVVFEEGRPHLNADLWILPLEGDRQPAPLARGPATETGAQFSPDGRFIAYHSLETDRAEVYIQPFPPNGQRWQASTDGGLWPRWRGDGRELFYQNDDHIFGADVRTTPNAFEAGPPRGLLRIPEVRSWAVTRGGQRFLAAVPDRTGELPYLTVVLNWSAALAGGR